MTFTVHRTFHVRNNGCCGAPVMREGRAPAVGERVPRVAKLMALAIRFEGLMRAGVVSGHGELARLAHVSQTRMSQVMALLNLAPDVQEALLFLPRVEAGRARVTEKLVRPIAAEVDWRKQRGMWEGLYNQAPATSPARSLSTLSSGDISVAGSANSWSRSATAATLPSPAVQV